MAAKKITSKDLSDKKDQLVFKRGLNQAKLNQGILTEAEKDQIKAEITLLDRDIAELENDLSELEEAEKSQRDAKHWLKEKPMVERAITENHVGYLIAENKLIYCRDFGKTQGNAMFQYIEATGKKPVRFFNQLCDYTLKGADELRIVDLLEEMKRSYLTTTTSFNDAKWNERDVYNQADVIMKFWLTPNTDESENYNRDFDTLMYCVGGGKAENIRHLEQWVAYKYCHPSRVANTPNLDIGGKPGGNGKGRFVKLTETIFTPVCVIEAAAKEISAGFNANWAQAVVIHYDEPESDELPDSKIKNATGGESQRIEKKGIDAYMADRNHSFVFTSNNDDGVVKLSGNRSGEDRRYSVISTNIPIVNHIMETYGCSLDEAMDRTNQIALMVKDPVEVAKWLAHIITKHDVMSMEVLKPLHGTDYSNRFEDQKNPITNAFDRFLPVFMKYKFVSKELLAQIVHILTDNSKWSENGVKKEFFGYLKNKGLQPTEVPRVRVNYTWRKTELIPDYAKRPQRTIITLLDEQNQAMASTYDFECSDISSGRLLNIEELKKVNCSL